MYRFLYEHKFSLLYGKRPKVLGFIPVRCCCYCCSVTKSCPTATPWTATCQGFPVLHYLPEFAQTHVHWVSDAIQPSHPSFITSSPLLQSFPTSGSFPVSQHFASGSLSIGAWVSVSVIPMNIQSWFPIGLTGLTSLLSKGLSRVFSSITIRKHHFFGTQPSLWSNSHICTWLLEKP